MISIMILDDQPAILQGLKELVEKTGLGRVVATETNGHEALISVQKHHPDLILVDVSMPEMSGIEFARHLKDRREDTKILAVSAYANNVYVRSMFNADTCSRTMSLPNWAVPFGLLLTVASGSARA